jgi:hypothetical protein
MNVRALFEDELRKRDVPFSIKPAINRSLRVFAAVAAFCGAHASAEPFEWFQSLFRDHTDAILVCIYKEGPLPGNVWDREGTVVQSLKGDWKVGEKIHIQIELEADGKDRSVSEVGALRYFFVDHHTATPVDVETGASISYDTKLAERIANFLHEQKKEDRSSAKPGR